MSDPSGGGGGGNSGRPQPLTRGIFDPRIFDPRIFDIWHIRIGTTEAPRQPYDDGTRGAPAPRQRYVDTSGRPIYAEEEEE